MGNVVFGAGPRFLSAATPPISAEAFVQRALEDRGVRAALGEGPWRLLYVKRLEDVDKHTGQDVCRECEAVFYDYAGNRAVRVHGPAEGDGAYRIGLSAEQPLPSREEFEDAVEL